MNIETAENQSLEEIIGIRQRVRLIPVLDTDWAQYYRESFEARTAPDFKAL